MPINNRNFYKRTFIVIILFLKYSLIIPRVKPFVSHIKITKVQYIYTENIKSHTCRIFISKPNKVVCKEGNILKLITIEFGLDI